MTERDYGSYIEDIIEHMNYAEDFIRNTTFEEFANDKKTILSVTKCIEVVGEATKPGSRFDQGKISRDSLARYGRNQR